MQFRTEIQLAQSNTLMNLHHPILTVGSCFADAIGNTLSSYKFKSLSNPFGVAYNPHSIHTQLLYAIHNQPAPENTYLVNKDIHLNYNFHSSLSDLSQAELRKKIIDTTGLVHYFLKDAQWLIITYGTAWVYTRKDSGELVANCHKMPADYFDKELFTQKKMLDSFDAFYKELKAFNKNIRIILTVSPVRHVKDTLSLNNVSKSVLRLGCHTISEQHEDVDYFPAYEIILDDLRDYRFYKNDMIHPSTEAETYIWEKFTHYYLDPPTKEFIEKWKNIRSALNHKPFHPTSTSHQKFLKDLVSKLETCKPLATVDDEIAIVRNQLIEFKQT